MRRIHVSWLIGLFAGGLLAGVAVAPLLHQPIAADGELLVAAVSLFVFSIINRRLIAIGFIVLSGFLVGTYRGDIAVTSFIQYPPSYGQTVKIKGKVSEDTTITTDGEQRIQLKEISLNKKPLDGKIWISTKSNQQIDRSDIVEASGELGEGFGSFQASIHRAELKQVSKVQHSDLAREVRDWFSNGAKEIIREPEVSLGIGYLTGQRNTLPEQLDENLRILGLTHVVVASGYNLTILVRITRRALAKISKYLATSAALIMMSGFILVTGFSPSMSRAGIVTGLSLLAWYFGRKIHPFVLLPLAAAITVLIDPVFIWGDIGWYLSFAAFAGVIILAPLLTHYFFGEKELGTVPRILVETTSAQIATMPIIAYVFGQYGPLAVPANLLILPFVPLAMALTFVAGVASVSGIPFAGLFGLPAQGLLDYMTTTIDKLAALPIAHGELGFSPGALAVSYTTMVLAGVFLWRRTNHNFKQDSIVE
jgi:competence protein ComEC